MAFDLTRGDTICALATARGRSAIAVVRVSGRRAFALRDAIFRRRRAGDPPPFVAVRGDVLDRDDRIVDDAVCVSFPGPRSYTGEDLVELSLHGSPLVVDLVVARLLELGARPAEPGELTLRAVLNGRLDLASAEAVDVVVASRTTAALFAAQRALRGGLQAAVDPVRALLVDQLAELEARLDFPDEELGIADRSGLRRSLVDAGRLLDGILQGARRGRRLSEGARVLLFGAPNAGKSTLLNALVGSERALVHDEPGTTRDVLEAEVEIEGVAVVVVDVAGVREEAHHPVERAGIARALAEVEKADVVVVVTPAGSEPFAPPASASQPPLQQYLAVFTKVDLVPGASGVSALTGAGLPELKRAIAQALGAAHVDDDEGLVQTARQEHALRECRAAVDDALGSLEAPDEVVCSELRRAARCLDRLLGRDVSADVLDLVFTRFCIGK
ncbi:MAG: tRNA uridine-5-carboxymethylaminomethyl(34) synthesis GTPase MnmE [Deltaproteobacteria bacterium]|nr:tRNA uridine-5-carboxymethylaminomethyl(34) synthesis GTPase MnmE [Deltaproteobacteria bacterium]